MIIILSKEVGEITTDEVIDWLSFQGQKFLRFNADDFEKSKVACRNDFVSVNGVELKDLDDVPKVIWFRRWDDPNRINEFLDTNIFDNVMYYYHLRNEYGALTNLFFRKINNNASWVNEPQSVFVNKLEILDLAKSVDLQVPETIVTNSKQEVVSFVEEFGEIIVKPLSEVIHMKYKDYSFIALTEILSRKDIDKLPETFYPSLFQCCVEKFIEIRVFVLDTEVFSMAIFSQNDKQTKSDFRNYNRQKPNRYVPFSLPEDIEMKVLKLMKKARLETGSLDFILTPDNEFVFLEINPVGQFGMMSKPCNYYLEKKMSIHLKNKQEKFSAQTIEV